MEAKENKLKVGDKVYIKMYSGIHSVHTIERVTPTQALCNEGRIKFGIEISNYGTVRKIGKDRWNSASYYIETEELKQQLWRQQSINKCKTIDFTKLTDEQLKKVLEII